MHYVYVISSNKDNKHCTGFTSNLRKRFRQHDSGEVVSTKGRGPFKLIYYEACLNKHDAIARERYLTPRGVSCMFPRGVTLSALVSFGSRRVRVTLR